MLPKFKHVDFTILTEAHDEEGKDWDVVLIQAGLSANKKNYSPEVLKQSQSIFENAKCFAFEFPQKIFNHLPSALKSAIPQGFPRKLVGWFDNVRFQNFKDDDGKEKEGLLARFHVSESAKWLRDFLKDAWEHGKKSLLGFSIDGGGFTTPAFMNGKLIQDVKSIEAIDSVDIVTSPAAGGQLIRLVASANLNEGENNVDWLKNLVNVLKETKPAVLEGIDVEKITEEQKLVLVESLLENKGFFEHLNEGPSASVIIGALGDLQSLMEKAPEAIKTKATVLIDKIKEAISGYGYGMNQYGYPSPSYAGVYRKVQATPPAEPIQPANNEPAKKGNEDSKLKEQIDSLSMKLALSEARQVLKDMLDNSSLPVIIKEKLSKQYFDKIFQRAELQESIKIEKDIMAEFVRQGAKIPGQEVVILREEKDKMSLALDGFFENADVEKVPRFRSFREAYAKITGRRDDDVFTIMRECYHMIPQEVRGTAQSRLLESMKTSDWGEILGDSITRKMIKEYSAEEYNDWRKVVSDIVPIKDFRTNRRMLMGGYGALPAVAEQGTYQSLTSPTDAENTYAISKKGGLEDLTMEMVANDDVGAIRRIPVKLGRAAAITLYQAIFDIFVNNTATTYDGVVLFHASSHSNLGSTALSSTELGVVKKAMMKQKVYGSTIDFIGMMNNPKYILVPADLEDLAWRLTTSVSLIGATNNAGTEPNIHSTYGLQPIVISYWTDATDWVACANPKNVPTIEVGFFNGKEEPELFVQDMPNVGSMFNADKMTYKIRHIWGYCLLDYRFAYKEVVSG